MKDIFKIYEKPVKGGFLNQPLIDLRGHQCECCGNTTWLNQPITLHVHHINGDRKDNRLENLKLLCPNCHSYTDNFGSKNNKRKEVSDEILLKTLKESSSIRKALLDLGLSDSGANYKRARKLLDQNNIKYYKYNTTSETIKENYCKICGKAISLNATYCIDCWNLLERKVDNRPTREELKVLIRNKSFVQIGKDYNVSDNAIRKWCDFYNLPRTKKEINSYSNEKWEEI